MHTIRRSALVEHSTMRMFDLINDIAAYPRRFDWCSGAELIESTDDRVVARLDLGLGSLSTWFTTANILSRPNRIEMKLVDGPFRALSGIWRFTPLGEAGSKVELLMDFEVAGKLVGSALALGFQRVADRMVSDFVRAGGSVA